MQYKARKDAKSISANPLHVKKVREEINMTGGMTVIVIAYNVSLVSATRQKRLLNSKPQTDIFQSKVSHTSCTFNPSSREVGIGRLQV